MPFSTTALNQSLDALAGGTPTSIIAFASLHTAFSTTGTNELTGGTPAYARKAITFSAASSGSKASSTSPVFDIPPLTTVAYVGLWSAVTVGTFAGMGANGGATQFAFTALASTDIFTAPGSAYSNGDTVVVFPGAGATLPTGGTPPVAGTIYFVISVSGATFQLSATSGGAALNFTSDGAGIIQKVVTETFNAQGTFTLSTDTLTLV
jgi:hypothetical protein